MFEMTQREELELRQLCCAADSAPWNEATPSSRPNPYKDLQG